MASFDELFNAVRAAQNRAGGVREGAAGFSSEYDAGLKRRQAAFADKLKAAGLAQDQANTEEAQRAKEAELNLKIDEAQRGYPLYDPTGTKVVGRAPGSTTFQRYERGKGLIRTPVKGDTKPTPGDKPPKVLPAGAGAGNTADPQTLAANIDLMERLLTKTTSGPVAGRIVSGASALTGGAVGEDEAVYKSFAPSIAAQVYRAVTHDMRLSDQDAATRAMPLLPKLGETEAVQKKKIAVLRDIVQNQAGAVSPEQFPALIATKLGSVPTQTATPAETSWTAEDERRLRELEAAAGR